MSQVEVNDCVCPDGVDVNICGTVKVDPSSLPGSISWSLEEQWTGKYWIDGKKVYQKTIFFGTLPPRATSKEVPHGIANIQKLVKAESTATHSQNARQTNLPCNETTLGCSNEAARMGVGYADMQVYRDAFITLQYTCTDR